ncbi:MAG: XdhC/CoxI family protein [Chitinophagaceae bacterium]|nr:MAG: XdhC/CoxI family protein [Chitinophagaceae bacterium]
MNSWKFILQRAEEGKAVALLYVLESIGSSPGRQGFHMAVASDGTMQGSIGGGIMEHKFVEMAKAQLSRRLPASSLSHRQIHDKTAAAQQSGMICSGEQTIFLHEITNKDLESIAALLQSLEHHRNGTLFLNRAGLQFSAEIPASDFSYTLLSATEFQYAEKTGFKNQLHVIGGGHCSLALCRLMSQMDFLITVYEDRAQLNTIAQNIYAHQKKLVNSYSELSESLTDAGSNCYVVIMTVGYRSDEQVLRALVGKYFRYIGLLGSRNKIKQLFAAFEVEGIDPGFLNKIHSPIGVQIKSQTPEEIAVSIAAEIIAEKNGGQ